jgi:hypothetical protein
MVTDGDLARSLNALSTTLNDQKLGEFDVSRLQKIVTGATGGEPILSVHQGSPTGGFLVDDDGEQVAEVKLADGGWKVERWRESRSSHAYVPSPG